MKREQDFRKWERGDALVRVREKERQRERERETDRQTNRDMKKSAQFLIIQLMDA